MKRTKTWCDVMSLSPPDGKFLEELRDAITHINRNSDSESPPVIRMMFGNIIGKLSIFEQFVELLVTGTLTFPTK